MRTWFWMLASLVALAYAAPAEAGHRGRACGGCTPPPCLQVQTAPCYTVVSQPVAMTTVSAPAVPSCVVVSEPWKDLRVVLAPSYVTETQSVCATEYQTEERQRVVKVSRVVPIEEEVTSSETVWVTKQETRRVNFTVLVPVKEERTKEFKTTVPVWENVEEKYTVRVPQLKEVMEKYTVRAPVVKSVEFTYTVQVPVPVTKKVKHTVSNVEPVLRTKTIQECDPRTATQVVEKDYGHWESRVVEVPVTRTVYRLGRCRTITTCTCVCQNVWVPNVVREEETVVTPNTQTREIQYVAYEPVTQDIDYECTEICYQPETRKGTKQVVEYADVEKTRARKVAEYVDEQRTRVRPVLKLKEEVKVEKYPVITYKKEKRSKDVTYDVTVPETRSKTEKVVRHEEVVEDKIETYSVQVPVVKVVQSEVRVEKFVPKVETVLVQPCAPTATVHHVHSTPVQAPISSQPCCGQIQK